MFVTPAFAQAGAAGSGNILVTLMPFVLIFAIMYFLMIRPQRQRMKKHEEMIAAVRRGDTVVSSGGFVAKVTKVIDDKEIQVELAEGVRVRLVRHMISDVRTKGEPAKDEETK